MDGVDVKTRKKFLTQLREKLLSPKVDDQKLEACLQQLREKIPVPVFWLLGKAQSGKTSIIRALTGSSRAEIGNGFQPCTRTSQVYDFPDSKDCLLKFLDTRGLGEVDYDPTEDMRVLESQSHLIMVVMKAYDHAQQSVLTPLKKILRSHPHWPLIVVQTSLHDGYGTMGPPPVASGAKERALGPGQHLMPYPFDKLPYPPEVPQDLSRTLAAQRELFKGMNARFVPLDFTLPEDNFEIENYGLDALWEAIEDALPLGLRGMLQEARDARGPLRDIYFRTAHPHILAYATVAGAAAAIPIPMVDIPVLLSIQTKMFHSIASIYQQSIDGQLIAEIGGSLGLGFAARMGGRELLKVIPGLGSVVSSIYAAASTYALGRTLCVYFSRVRHGDVPDKRFLQKLYAEQFEEGRKRLEPYLKKILPGTANGAAKQGSDSTEI